MRWARNVTGLTDCTVAEGVGAFKSNPGNGIAGFTFVVDELQQPTFDGWLTVGGVGTRLALEASVNNFGDGPETFLIYNLDTVQAIPEPQMLAPMLAGLAMGVVVRRRRPN